MIRLCIAWGSRSTGIGSTPGSRRRQFYTKICGGPRITPLQKSSAPVAGDLISIISVKRHRIKQLLDHISRYYKLSVEAQQAICDCFEERRLTRNEYLLTEGQICRHLYFLEKGVLRGYYNLDGKEVTYWFGFENDFVTSFHSFITRQPSLENIQLLEDGVAWAIPKEKLENLLDKYHELEKLVRITYENYYLRLEERFVNAQFKTATERYRDLLLQSPHILERVPLGHVAAYLGISQETLSRIRGKI